MIQPVQFLQFGCSIKYVLQTSGKKKIQQRQKKSVKGRRMQVLQNTTMKFLQAQISLISNKFLPFCRPWGGTPGVGGIPIGGGGTPMGWKPKGG